MRSWNAFLLASVLAACTAPAAAGQDRPGPEPDVPAPAPEPAAERPPEPAPGPGPPPALPQPADAQALLETFAAMPGLEARFVEEKQLALLAAPLHMRGVLYFQPPGHLARVVEEPERSVVTLSPTKLRMSGPDGEQTVDLRQNPDVRTFVTSLVQVFSGDRAALERSYALDFEVGETGWTLGLTPRGPPLSELMAELRLRGSGTAVAELQLLEPNGDRTVTRIVEADTERRFTPEERTRLFGLLPR